MRKFLAGLYDKWRERRLARAGEVLDRVKVRYHTFRILLANNELALNLLRSVDQALMSPTLLSPEALADDVEELIEITYELIDGLNRLSWDRHGQLYARHQALAGLIREALSGVVAAPSRLPGCIPLMELAGNANASVGSKAGNLGFLKQAGFPVPDGFAVTAAACEKILIGSGIDVLVRKSMQRLENRTVEDADFEPEAAEIQERVRWAVFSPEFGAELERAYSRLTDGGRKAISVRSSALVEDLPEHSFAGQFKSVLNVTSFKGLEEALKEVIASNFSVRSISYRLHAGLPPAWRDMAVLCQLMAPARAAGGLFTLEPAAPDSGRVLLSAVPGLGVLAVGGSAPADLYRPLRDGWEREPMEQWARITVKTRRAVGAGEGGGIREEEPPEEQRHVSVLREEEVHELVRIGRMIETLIGKPQDIEWAVGEDGEIFILQSRDIRLAAKDRQAAGVVRGEPLLQGGVCASPGRRVGRVKVVHSVHDLEEWRKGEYAPSIMVLHQSMVDAAAWLAEFEGVVVDLGNPADHLSCVAREYSRPMLTGTGKATEVLGDGQWVVLDADRAAVLRAPEEVWAGAEDSGRKRMALVETRRARRAQTVAPELAGLRQLIQPLNLTDAYGPTFTIQECKSLHDMVRYTHEMAVLAMFETGDEVLDDAEVLVRRLDENVPLHFLIIDLGGGVAPGCKGFKAPLKDILSVPLLALWKGISTPGLRWSQPPPMPGISGLVSRAMLDGAGARPVGQQNYALITRDYLNLNARVDFHFTMVDAVCGANPRENYIRFRFKGGGTSVVQRERRARFIASVLESYNFFTDQRGDLVTGAILETEGEEIEERLVMIGRLLGFSRLLDATMCDDGMPGKVARAFLDGDYALESLNAT